MPKDPHENADIDSAYGSLIVARRAKASWLLIVLFTFFALVLLVSGLGLIAEKTYLTGAICVAISLPFFALVWFQLSLSQDEIRIYQNGFTYRRRGKLQECSWLDIKSLTFASGRSNTFTLSVSSALADRRGSLVAVRKNSDELIRMNEYLRCENEMLDAIKLSRNSGRSTDSSPDR